MLQINRLNVFYGIAHALRDVSLHLERDEIGALLGNNGAGKSTLLNAVSGLVRPHSGTISFLERDITRERPNQIVKLGVGHVPEGKQLFRSLTVVENLELGAYLRFGRNHRQEIREDLEKVLRLFPGLAGRKRQLAGTLSGGEQQMLSIGRTLMGQPRLILLDEPSLGLAPMVIAEIFEIIGGMKGGGMAVLVVEQNAMAALRISDRAYVMENGAVALQGTPAEVLQQDRILSSYLGRRKIVKD